MYQIGNDLEIIENIQQTAFIVFMAGAAFGGMFGKMPISDRAVYLWGITFLCSGFVALCMTIIIIWS